MRVALIVAGILAVGVVWIGAPASAQCPRDIHDCSDTPLPGDGTTTTSTDIDQVIAQLLAGGIALTASVDLDSGGLQAGATESVHLAMSNQSASGSSNITISMHDAFGASFSGKQGAAFTFDPGSGITPTGDFQFRVNARSGHVSIPIRLTVVDDQGTHEDFAVLNVPVESRAASGTAGWLMPGLIGVLLGALVASLVLRGKRGV